MELNKFEQEVKAKMEQRTLKPSPMAWDRIDAMLSVTETQQQKPMRSYRWLYVAAAMILFMAAGMFFLAQDSTVVAPQETTVVTTTPKSTMPSEIKDAATPLQVPATAAVPQQQEAVAIAQNAKQGASHHMPVKHVPGDVKPATQQEQEIAESAPAVQRVPEIDNQSLVAAADVSPKTNAGKVKVDSKELLSSVEGELEDNFRSKMLQSVTRNFNTVKTAVVNRNHE